MATQGLTSQHQGIYSQSQTPYCWPVKQAADTEGLKGHTQLQHPFPITHKHLNVYGTRQSINSFATLILPLPLRAVIKARCPIWAPCALLHNRHRSPWHASPEDMRHPSFSEARYGFSSPLLEYWQIYQQRHLDAVEFSNSKDSYKYNRKIFRHQLTGLVC